MNRRVACRITLDMTLGVKLKSGSLSYGQSLSINPVCNVILCSLFWFYARTYAENSCIRVQADFGSFIGTLFITIKQRIDFAHRWFFSAHFLFCLKSSLNA